MSWVNRRAGRAALGAALLLLVPVLPACGVKGAPRPVLPGAEADTAPPPEEAPPPPSALPSQQQTDPRPGAGPVQESLPAAETQAGGDEQTISPAPTGVPCPEGADGGECP